MMVMISGEAYPSIIQIFLMNVLRGRPNSAWFNITKPSKTTIGLKHLMLILKGTFLRFIKFSPMLASIMDWYYPKQINWRLHVQLGENGVRKIYPSVYVSKWDARLRSKVEFYHMIKVFGYIFLSLIRWKGMLNIYFLATNCTEMPVLAPNNDRGKFDWTIEDRKVPNTEALPVHFGTLIRYW